MVVGFLDPIRLLRLNELAVTASEILNFVFTQNLRTCEMIGLGVANTTVHVHLLLPFTKLEVVAMLWALDGSNR